jgi:hypothetical protein
MKTLLALVFLAAAPTLAAAQSAPFVYPRTVGTSSSQVAPANPSRKRIMFTNPNATAIIAVCPAVSRVSGGNVSCTVNGAGSITVLPSGSIQIDGTGQNGTIPSAWNAIADTVSSALSVFEWE